MKKSINQGKVIELVVQANKAKNIYEIMETYKCLSRKATNRTKNDYREALLQLGVAPDEI